MVRSPDEYAILAFADASGAVAFCQDVIDFLLTPAGMPFTTGAERAVLWVLPPPRHPDAPKRCYAFVSEGGLRAAAQAGLVPEPLGTVPASAVPRECGLVFGDSLVDRNGSSAERTGTRFGQPYELGMGLPPG